MRAIKFRAWDKVKRCWFIPFIGGSSGNAYLDKNCVNSLPKEEYDLMQFTGLLDVNGTEIYEGDVLGGIFEGMTVEWCGKCNSFAPIYNIHGKECAACVGDISWRDIVDYASIKVIGNLHQNPELLK